MQGRTKDFNSTSSDQKLRGGNYESVKIEFNFGSGPSQKKKNCQAPPNPSGPGGQWSPGTLGSTVYQDGATSALACGVGYTETPPKSEITCSNGRWTDKTQGALAAVCKVPGNGGGGH